LRGAANADHAEVEQDPEGQRGYYDKDRDDREQLVAPPPPRGRLGNGRRGRRGRHAESGLSGHWFLRKSGAKKNRGQKKV
jgi:hypothetical protein